MHTHSRTTALMNSANFLLAFQRLLLHSKLTLSSSNFQRRTEGVKEWSFIIHGNLVWKLLLSFLHKSWIDASTWNKKPSGKEKKQTESLGWWNEGEMSTSRSRKKWKAGKSDGVSMCTLKAEIEGLFIEP